MTGGVTLVCLSGARKLSTWLYANCELPKESVNEKQNKADIKTKIIIKKLQKALNCIKK